MIIKKSELKLINSNHPTLYLEPEPFNFKGDADATMLCNIMFEKMKELGGVGLSANQLGLNIRMFVMGIDSELIEVFNPKILNTGLETVSLSEGCLSFPGINLMVRRPERVTASFQDRRGVETIKEFEGLTARIFLHEYDHMQGKIFREHVSTLKWNLAVKRRNHIKNKLVKKYSQKTLIDIYNEVKNAENTDRV